MSSPAIMISPYRSVADAARTMSETGVNRLPVVKGDELVGIVTRADLVRAFVRADSEIEQEIQGDVLRRTLWLDPTRSRSRSTGAQWRWSRSGRHPDDARRLRAARRAVPGVASVTSGRAWKVDDPAAAPRYQPERYRRRARSGSPPP